MPALAPRPSFWADKINPVRNKPAPPATCPIREKDLVRGSGRPLPVSTNATAKIGESTMGFVTALTRDARALLLSCACEVLSRITKVMGDTTMEPHAIATAAATK